MKKFLIETERLLLREFLLSDAEQMHLLNDDPEVLRYTGDPPFKGMEGAREFLRTYDEYRRNKMGRWAVISKADDAWMGWCGLKYHPGEGFVDLGYRFFKQYWNQGYATESSWACLKYGFGKLGLSEIVCRAVEENTASIRVMQKLGMTFKETRMFDQHPGIVYAISRDDFEKLSL